jgi:hypothetical protein
MSVYSCLQIGSRRHRRATRRDCAWPSRDCSGERSKATTSTGSDVRVPSRSTILLPSTTIARRWLAAATIFSRNKAPPSPLIRLSVQCSTSSAPSIVRSIWRCSLNEVSGMSAAFARAAVRSDVGMPTKRRPCRWRRASASTAKAAVEPLPSPTTMSFSTNCTAASAAARLRAIRGVAWVL